MEELICSVCGSELEPDEAYEFEDEIYCYDCIDEETIVCECCGNRVRRDAAIVNGETQVCRECYEESYNCCEDCGAIIHNDSTYYMDDYYEYPYCYNCYMRNKSKYIHDYSYKPDPIFYGDGNRYFGVELEVDDGGRCESNAREILEMVNDGSDDRLYIKGDGSLNDGFELVSHPLTLDYHLKNMPWENIMKRLVQMGYVSHKAGTCGLHCHINRTALGDTFDEQEEAIGRILYFVEHHWEEILRFSRRSEYQMEKWAARYGMKSKPKELYDNVKKGRSNRYRAVNILNYNTIEFRMFRGTLKYNSFAATLQFVNEICNVAISMSDDDMEKLTWEDFVKNIKEPELIKYLKERRLYTKEEM